MPGITDYILALRRQHLANFTSTIPGDMIVRRPANARPFNFGSNPPVAYPGGGVGSAGPVDVLAYQVPQGFNAVVQYMAIVHIGGGFVDGSGNVIWRVLINGGSAPGLDNQTYQIGTLAQPREIVIVLVENDLLEITVEVPAAKVMPANASTAALITGWEYPLAQTTAGR